MELSENETIEKYGKYCGHCNRNTPLPYEYGFPCLACEYKIIKRKHEISKIQRKKINLLIDESDLNKKNILFFC